MAGVLKSFGVRGDDSLITFLIVSTGELCEQIAEALHRTARSRKCRVAVHKCEAVSEVAKAWPDLRVDFLIFAFDSRLLQLLTEIEASVKQIDEHFFISGSACLICCDGIPSRTKSAFYRTQELSTKYNLRLLSAHISDLESRMLLSERILNVAEAVLGVRSGAPVLHFSHRYNHTQN